MDGLRDQRPLIEQCAESLRKLGEQVRPPAGVWSELDLTMSQLKAVFVLSGGESLSIGGLAHRLNISEPAASALVDRLEQADLAKRQSDPQDKRKMRVAPTAQAEDLAARLLRVKEGFMTQWLERLSDADLRALLRGTQALLSVARICSQPPDAAQPPARATNDSTEHHG